MPTHITTISTPDVVNFPASECDWVASVLVDRGVYAEADFFTDTVKVWDLPPAELQSLVAFATAIGGKGLQ